ncbi:MAG: (Fe-S)-binding protein [Thermodesulfovibrionales bacterium]
MAENSKTKGNQIARGLTRRQLVELESCVRCGECRLWCPSYAQRQQECITAMSKLRALSRLIQGFLPEAEKEEFLQGLYECSACGLCHVVCPVRINTHELWEQTRQSLSLAGIPQPEAQIKQMSLIKKFDNSYGKPQQGRGLWAKMAWESGFLMKPLLLHQEQPTSLLYYAGCTASFDPAMQSVAVQSARLLQEAGIEFSILGEEEPCCASKLRRMGDNDFYGEARKRAERIKGHEIETVVASCAGCYKGLHSDYETIWPEAQEVLHLTQFIDRLIREGRLVPRYEVPMEVTYHDPCHLGRHNQIYDEPRRILRAIRGLNLVEMPRHRAFSSCCGMGGGLKIAFPDTQLKMSASRIREAEETGAKAIVTPCQTCYLGLLTGVHETASSLRVYHLNELLALSLCPDLTRENIITAFALSPTGNGQLEWPQKT